MSTITCYLVAYGLNNIRSNRDTNLRQSAVGDAKNSLSVSDRIGAERYIQSH